MKRIIIVLLSLQVIFTLRLQADEGMWLLPLIKQLNIEKMQSMGLELSAEEIYSINQSSLKDAIVIFGRGCTGEIISDQGLLLTNHHCGYGQIQSHSTVENDYLSDGFWAMNQQEELENPDLTVTFLIRIEDVTKNILDSLSDDMDEMQRENIINRVSANLQEEAVDGTHYNAEVESFFEGNKFYLFVYETFKDVRLVGAPPSSIGKFGADTDNWMWPRHTGDFSLFRVYTAPDGSPAAYDEDNVPLTPKHHLPVSLKGVEKGDFTMIMGYPGGTQRYMTSYGIENVLSITHPNRIKIRGVRQEILMEDMQAEDEVRIKYASKYSRSSNYWKFSIGQSQGLERLKVLQKKQALEEDFREWVSAKESRQEKYGDALQKIERGLEEKAPYTNATQYYVETLLMGTEAVGFALQFNGLYGLLKSEDNDEERMAEITQRLIETAEDFYKNYNAPTDEKVAKAMLRLLYEDVAKEYQPDQLVEMGEKYKGDIEKYADKMYEKSMFPYKAKVMEFLENPSLKKLEKDPAFQLAQSVYFKYLSMQSQIAEFDAMLESGRRLFVAGLLEMQEDRVFYPDANFTMRLTYGEVGDYNPRDAVFYQYFTTLSGVMEKEDPDNWEFVVPEKLKSLYQDKDYGIYGEGDTMPVCFTSNNDITGGNSGSPVINGKGELIGLAFDGNWEAMSGDIAFEDELQKTINVDIRYVLFIIDKFAGAGHLVEEMTLVKN